MTLHEAAEVGDVAEVRRLVAKWQGARDVDGASDDTAGGRRHWAASRGHAEVMRDLVQLCVDKEANTAHGATQARNK
jgi:hypothetical protein